MAPMRWDPFRALRGRDDISDFDDLIRDLFSRAEGVIGPAIEVSETDGEVMVKAVIPGVEKDQLHVSVEDDRLTVRGETRTEEEQKGKNYVRREIRYGTIQRSVALPVEVDGEAPRHAAARCRFRSASDQRRLRLTDRAARPGRQRANRLPSSLQV